ncbi:MAG: MBL fold metallo-hydrolase, partial [Desulfobacteraceae bacterium]|nr:MBL fold metallo-hydrolase [Desulfobacteraceae bacterium]
RVKEGEEFAAELNQELMAFFAGADLLIHDAQYTAKEYYESRIGWGHTPMEYAINSAQKAGVKNLALVHHEPLYSDKKLDELSERYCESVNLKNMQVFFAREGMEINL